MVSSTGQTEPVLHSGDAADDPAVWVHPVRGERSLVLCTDKHGGIGVYSLSGDLVAMIDSGPINNIDIRQGVRVGSRTIDLLACSGTSDDTVVLYELDRASGRAETPPARIATPKVEGVYGLCIYTSPKTGSSYVFVNNHSGIVHQLFIGEANGALALELVRTFAVGGGVEGMVADDDLGWIYIGEEDAAVWRYNAEPDANTRRAMVCATRPIGNPSADIEGLAIYCASDTQGYLVISSQGSNVFFLYDRNPPHRAFGVFGVRGVTHTDGIEACAADLGGVYSEGIFIAQDDDNDGENQNMKLVPWTGIAQKMIWN